MKYLPFNEIETELINKIPRYFKIYQQLSINPPISISLSLTGLIGFGYTSKIPIGYTYPVDRDFF